MKMKKRNKITALLVTAALIPGLLPTLTNSKTAQAAATVKLFGGAYSLSKVTGKSTETIVASSGKKIKVTRYNVEKGAVIKAANRKSFSLTNLSEFGNESGNFDSYAKVDNKSDWFSRTYELKYKTISFTGNAKFQFQYETDKNKMSLVESGEMLGYIYTDTKNTIIIQVGSGKGNYYNSAKVSRDTFSVDGKQVKINEYYLSTGEFCYSLNDLSAAFKGSKASFTYTVNKGTVSMKPYTKSSKTIKLVKKKKVKASAQNLKLVNSLTGISGDYSLGILGGTTNDAKASGAQTGNVFDIYGEKASHGAVVGLYTDKGSNNQKWYLTK